MDNYASAKQAGQQYAAEATVQNALDQHEKMLAALVAELGDLCSRACGLADRMFGPQPESVGANEKEGPSPPTVRRLENLSSAAHMRVSALKGYVSRLERL